MYLIANIQLIARYYMDLSFYTHVFTEGHYKQHDGCSTFTIPTVNAVYTLSPSPVLKMLDQF